MVETLRTGVSQVYVTVRDICLVSMLIVIIYIAIRGLLALNPKEKSRYKENFVNCLIGVILIVSVHLIMSVSVKLVDMITEGMETATDSTQIDTSKGNAEHISDSELKQIAEDNLQDAESVSTISGASITVSGDKIYKALEEAGYPNVTLTDKPSWWKRVADYLPFVDYSDEYIVTIQCSSFTEQARYMCQEIYDVNEAGERTNENWNYIGWSLVYIMLVILTVAFVWLYGKRLFYLAVLTMFAPIVGVMYPINRQNGSRPQTLNLWFKEYMGNLLIQPFHLFLYTILVGSAMNIAINNPIFVIIALVAILFVEKLLKDMIGIQDTRIGGLGRAIQDTTRAIKTTERTAASVARGIGRAASNGARGLIGAYENYRNNSGEEVNTKPREQTLPPPEEAEILTGEVEDNNSTELSTSVQRNRNVQSEDDIIDAQYREISSEPLEDPNSKEEQFGLPKDEPLRLEMKEDDVEAGAAALNAEDNNILAGIPTLNNEEDIIDIDEPKQDVRQLPGFLEPDTLNMVDELNGNRGNLDFDTFNPPATLSGEGNPKSLLGKNSQEEFVRSDGERNVFRNKHNGNLRIEPENNPDFRPPMSVAMAAGNEARPINVGADRTIGFDDSLDGTVSGEKLKGRNSRRTSALGGGASNVVGNRTVGRSQNIPDDNNIRSKIRNDSSNINDNLNVWINPNEPLPSSNEKPEMKVIDGGRGRNVTQGTIDGSIDNGVNVNSQNVTSQGVRTVTNNVPNLNEQNVRTVEQDMPRVQVEQQDIRTQQVISGTMQPEPQIVDPQQVLSGTVKPEPQVIDPQQVLSGIVQPEPQIVNPQQVLSGTVKPEPQVIDPQQVLSGTVKPEPQVIDPQQVLSGTVQPEPQIINPQQVSSGTVQPEPQIVNPQQVSSVTVQPQPQVVNPQQASSGTVQPEPQIVNPQQVSSVTVQPQPQVVNPQQASSGTVQPEPQIVNPQQASSGTVQPQPQVVNPQQVSSGTVQPEPQSIDPQQANTGDIQQGIEQPLTVNNTGTNSSNANTGINNSSPETIHRLSPDEYQEIPPVRPGMQGASSSSDAESGINNNVNNTLTTNDTNTQDGQGNNQLSNNETDAPEEYEAKTARKVVDVGEKVVGRTASAVGTMAAGIADMATSMLGGEIIGAMDTGIGAADNSVKIATTGSPSKSRRKSDSEKATQSQETLSKEAETVVKKANISQNEAIALVEACKAVGINDDRNMVLIASVYKGASNADKSEIVKLSKLLHRMKEDGKSKNEAKNTLENESISNTTKELLLKMYDKLHI